MIANLVIGLVVAAVMYYLTVYRERKRREAWERKYPVYKPQLQSGVWQTRIANIKYQCNRDDIGAVIFAVKAEENNVYNADSMTILRDEGKVLGYIGKREAQKFNRWSGRQTCSGVGMVLYDSETNKLWGDIIVFTPDTADSTIEAEISRYMQWVTTTYGTAFIPERYR